MQLTSGHYGRTAFCAATYRRQRHGRIQALSGPENSSPGSTHFAKPDKRSLIPSEEQSPLTLFTKLACQSRTGIDMLDKKDKVGHGVNCQARGSLEPALIGKSTVNRVLHLGEIQNLEGCQLDLSSC